MKRFFRFGIVISSPVERVLATDGFTKLKPFEERMLRTPISRSIVKRGRSWARR